MRDVALPRRLMVPRARCDDADPRSLDMGAPCPWTNPALLGFQEKPPSLSLPVMVLRYIVKTSDLLAEWPIRAGCFLFSSPLSSFFSSPPGLSPGVLFLVSPRCPPFRNLDCGFLDSGLLSLWSSLPFWLCGFSVVSASEGSLHTVHASAASWKTSLRPWLCGFSGLLPSESGLPPLASEFPRQCRSDPDSLHSMYILLGGPLLSRAGYLARTCGAEIGVFENNYILYSMYYIQCSVYYALYYTLYTIYYMLYTIY